MSSIREFRNIALSQMKAGPIKTCVARLMDTMDEDLDVQGYEQSSLVDDAVKNLNDTITSEDTEKEEADMASETTEEDNIRSIGYRDKEPTEGE